MKPQTEAPAPVSLAPDKPRYEWIDNARVIAALLIIYVHMPWFFCDYPHVNNRLAWLFVNAIPYYGRIPFFLILAGYFLARRITWHKAFDRAFWLFIPFLLWNVLYYIKLHLHTHPFEHFCADFTTIIGLGSVFTREFVVFDSGVGPTINVSWFLRDIIVLSLVTPILARFKYIALILLVIVCSFSSINMAPEPRVLLSLGTCFYYILGICLVDFRIADAYRIFNKKFTPFVILGVAAAIIACLVANEHQMRSIPMTLVGSLFGAMMIAHCGVLIETHLPKFSKLLAPCGPACFLVFMLHEPVIVWCMWLLPEWFKNSWLVWFYPFVACALIIAIFLLMKRYTPWLMPYLGHMKVPKKQG